MRILTLTGEIVLASAVVAAFVWLKWQQIKHIYGRDLGDGGVQTLFGSRRDSSPR